MFYNIYASSVLENQDPNYQKTIAISSLVILFFLTKGVGGGLDNRVPPTHIPHPKEKIKRLIKTKKEYIEKSHFNEQTSQR